VPLGLAESRERHAWCQHAAELLLSAATGRKANVQAAAELLDARSREGIIQPSACDFSPEALRTVGPRDGKSNDINMLGQLMISAFKAKTGTSLRSAGDGLRHDARSHLPGIGKDPRLPNGMRRVARDHWSKICQSRVG
jgi:hypothetical protein